MPMMTKSRMPDQWIMSAVAGAPFTKMKDNEYRTAPGRLSFVNAVEPLTHDSKGKQLASPKYELTYLGAPGTNEQIDAVLWPDVYNMMKTNWPSRVQADGRLIGLQLPWRDQGERISRKTNQLYDGMNPGLRCIKMNTSYKPQIVDANYNPIVDPKRIYAGVWAVLLFNIYDYDNQTAGVGCGLNGIMLVADDDSLEGGGPDMKQAFAGVQVDARFDAAAGFGTPPAPGAPPPAPGTSFMPAPVPVGGPPPPPPRPAGPPPAPPAPPAAPGFDMASMLS